MSAEAPFSFTTKVNGDLLTVRGDDFASFVSNLGYLLNVPAVAYLSSVLNGEVSAAVEQAAVATVQQSLGGQVIAAPAPVPQTVAVPQQQFAPVAPPQQQFVQQPQAPAGAGPSCAHGAMKQIPGGISKKTGKPYNAFWACQWPNRDEQCPAIYPN